MRKSTLLLILAALSLRALAADRVTVEQLQQALAAAYLSLLRDLTRPVANIDSPASE